MSKEVKESGTTADVSVFDMPLSPSGNFYNKPYFIVTQKEFNYLIKNNEVPQRIKNYAHTNGTNDVWIKYDKVTFNLNKFFSLENK